MTTSKSSAAVFNASEIISEPWYRQFWPWFLFGLPACVVVAGFVTLGIAIANRDARVDGDYYREGLARVADHSQERSAAEHRIKAYIVLRSQPGGDVEVSVTLRSEAQSRIAARTLRFAHPVDSRRDVLFSAAAVGKAADDTALAMVIDAQSGGELHSGWWNLVLTGDVENRAVSLHEVAMPTQEVPMQDELMQDMTTPWRLQGRCWIPESLHAQCALIYGDGVVDADSAPGLTRG